MLKRDQTEFEKLSDKIYVRMETGNFGEARTLMRELKDKNPEQYRLMRVSLLADYGRSL